MLQKVALALLVLVFLAGCGPAATPSISEPVETGETVAYPPPSAPVTSNDPLFLPYPSPLSAQPGDDKLTRGNVFMDSLEILVLESFPPQFNVVMEGNLPTPCHDLRYVKNEPDAQNRINIEVYSISDPDTICTQVLVPFQQAISLGSLPAGNYEVYVNDTKAGDIAAP